MELDPASGLSARILLLPQWRSGASRDAPHLTPLSLRQTFASYEQNQGDFSVLFPGHYYLSAQRETQVLGYSVAYRVVKILPWFCAVVSTANNGTQPGFFEVPQRGNDTADRLLDITYPAGVTSSLDSLEKVQPGDDLFRGYGSWLTDSMPKSPLLLVQKCFAILTDCWSMVMLLLVSGDIEENPGPNSGSKVTEMLQAIIDRQEESDRKIA
ncbi:hypothetical protein HPB52_008225 [Rhipicephalus sanguineus]|uniref:Uncharacterized protein n=1 Tax=Rhipicephalus sanguineus TaxID=34632 RepID=A0A9D4QD12_RHISA|nr:hypothetical protein HPB52_008225 [Rhipicephalus sanguineus]